MRDPLWGISSSRSGYARAIWQPRYENEATRSRTNASARPVREPVGTDPLGVARPPYRVATTIPAPSERVVRSRPGAVARDRQPAAIVESGAAVSMPSLSTPRDVLPPDGSTAQTVQTRASSSTDVIPAATLATPSYQSVRMPSSAAARSISSRGAFARPRAARGARSSRAAGRRRCGRCSPCCRSGRTRGGGGRSSPARPAAVSSLTCSRSSSSTGGVYGSAQCDAQLAGEPLREHRRDGGAGHERLHAHLVQPRERGGSVVRVQRREHEVPGQRGLDRDAWRSRRRGSRRP